MIDGFNMFIRDDQNMRRRDRVNIAEGRHLFIPVNDGRFDFIIDDFTEYAVGHG